MRLLSMWTMPIRLTAVLVALSRLWRVPAGRRRCSISANCGRYHATKQLQRLNVSHSA